MDNQDNNSTPGDAEFRITDLPRMDNIATILDDARLSSIAQDVITEFKIDKQSRSDREDEWKAADEAFKLKRESKSYPFDNASNVKYPLLLEAAIDFQSRVMPAIINNGKVVKGKVVGQDQEGQKAEQGDRVSSYLNYQFLERDDIWMDETDKMALQLPIYGSAIKKLYNDPVRGNVSELVSIKDFVVNAAYPSLERAPRATQCFDLYPYEIEERKRDGRFLDVDMEMAPSSDADDDDTDIAADTSTEDDQASHPFLEQHRVIDLDEDGYPEPYIVTVHKPSEKVVRITAGYDLSDILVNDEGAVAKIKRRPVFKKYDFIPDPEGGFYSIGFGRLLHDPVNIINSIINQIMDAGSLQNAGGGFIGKEFRLKAGVMRQELGKWKQVPFAGQDIRQAIVPFDHKGASPVLFQMLGFMTDMAKGITAQRDVLDGSAPANQPAASTLALIEQGLKVFTGIVGRVLRGLNDEAKGMYELNARYMNEEEYFTVGDNQQSVMREDFNIESYNVCPVADSSTVTDMQKMGRAQALLQFANDPLFNPQEIRRRYIEAIGVPAEGLFAEPPQPTEEQALAMQAQIEQLLADIEKTKADTAKSKASAMKDIASIENDERKTDIDEAVKTMDSFKTYADITMRPEGANGSQSRELRGMVGESGYGTGFEGIAELFPGGESGSYESDVVGGLPYPGTSDGFGNQ